MSGLNAYDLDGTIRPGTLVSEAIHFGAALGFVDLDRFQDPDAPSYDEAWYFVDALTGQSAKVFKELTDKISDEARDHSFDWALERMETQANKENDHIIIISHAPDFLVRAFVRGLGIVHHGRGSWYHTSNLVFSGRAVKLDKSRAASRYMRERRLSNFAFAAGDTQHDLPLLSRAETAVVVNPDEALAETAQEKGWEIITTEQRLATLQA